MIYRYDVKHFENVSWIDEEKCIWIKDVMTYWMLSLFGISASSSSAPSFFFLNLTLRIVNLPDKTKINWKNEEDL